VPALLDASGDEAALLQAPGQALAQAAFMYVTGHFQEARGPAYERFERIASMHHGEALFLKQVPLDRDSNPCHSDWRGKESISVFRPWDRFEPHVCLDAASTSQDLWSDLIFLASQSVFPELTTRTLPQVFRVAKPLVILFVRQNQELRSSALEENHLLVVQQFLENIMNVKRTALTGNGEEPGEASLNIFNDISFVWMNIDADPAHMNVFKSYHPKGTDQTVPTISYVDLKLGKNEAEGC
jgi:hypothetical protein